MSGIHANPEESPMQRLKVEIESPQKKESVLDKIEEEEKEMADDFLRKFDSTTELNPQDSARNRAKKALGVRDIELSNISSQTTKELSS